MPHAKQTCNEATAADAAFRDGQLMLGNLFSATQTYLAGMSRYTTDFFIPYMLASQYFREVEGRRLIEDSPADSFEAYLKLLQNNLELMERSARGTAYMISAYVQSELGEFTEALQHCFFELKHEKLSRYIGRQAELLDMVTRVYPRTIEEIEPEFGFHFERGEHVLFDETD